MKLSDYIDIISEMCRLKGWARDWESGGVYVHLEASEFIESLRNKRDNKNEEFGDLLFVIFSMVKANNIDVDEAMRISIEKNIQKIDKNQVMEDLDPKFSETVTKHFWDLS